MSILKTIFQKPTIVGICALAFLGSSSLLAQTAALTRDDLATHAFHPAGMPERKPSITPSAKATKIGTQALQQIKALALEKQARNSAQRKLDSAILYTERMLQGHPAAPGVPLLDTSIELDSKDRLAVDISAEVSGDLLQRMKELGALVTESHPQYRSLRAMVPAGKIEEIAAWPEVHFIAPKRNAVTSHVVTKNGVVQPYSSSHSETVELTRARLKSAIKTHLKSGAGIVESEGDVTHKADVTRPKFGIDGTGLKIGVVSSGVDSLAQSQATGDVGPVTILPGQAGSGDEGTAMLEIIHDLAPGAALYFATANPSIEQFAENVHGLQAAGCNIIVDDVTYFGESVFQSGQTATVLSPTDAGLATQAVNDAVATGVFYFSAAGNAGNLDSTGSGTWEGDFVDGGPADGILAGVGDVHLFAPATPYDAVTVFGGPLFLQWADPLGASANDYDIYLVSSDGTVVYNASTNIQDGTQDPSEFMFLLAIPGDLVYITKNPAAKNVFLHLGTFSAQLAINTVGAAFGHNAAETAFTVGATPAHLALQDGLPSGPYPNPFNSSNVVEPYSSDGPRRVFFDADATPITAGNYGATGGKVLAKPDFTAADGVAITGVGGFPNPFFGTSAAAPHAAAIAALVLSAKPTLTRDDVSKALSTTAIDIMGAGHDNSSGAGIIMADGAVNSTGSTGFSNPQLGTITVAENPGNKDGIITAGEGAKLTIQLGNSALVTAGSITSTLSSSDPSIHVTQPGTAAYPDLKTGDSAMSDFTFTLPSDWDDCTGKVDFTMTLAYSGGPAATRTLTFSVPVGANPILVSGVMGTPASGITGVTSHTGIQNGRVFRDGNPSVCGTPKTYPGTLDANPYAYDSYTFTSCRNGCLPLDLQFPDSGVNGILFASAYSPEFNPADPSVNYIGDAGTSDIDTPFAVPASAGSSIEAVVTDASNSDAGEPYVLKIPGCALTCVSANQVPVVKVQNVTVAAGADGTASASIDNGSYDPDAGDTITTAQTPAGPYAKGDNNVMLTVTDSKGAIAQASATVTVVDAVTIKPEADSGTVQAGNSVTYKLDITSAAGEVTFACSGLPADSTCSFNGFNPGSSNGQGSGTVDMTISTKAASTTAAVIAPESRSATPMYLAFAIPLLGFLGLGSRVRRKSFLRVVTLCGLGCFLLAWSACGGSSHSSTTAPGTPAGTYSVSVTATNSGGTATTNVTLIVQ